MFYRVLLTACLLACAIKPAFAHSAHTSFNNGSSGGPINTMPAATMPEGSFAVGINNAYMRSERFSDAELVDFASQHIHGHSTDWMMTTSFGASYGISNDFMLSVSVPFVHRDTIRAGHHMHVGGMAMNDAENHGNASGIGDIAALGQYRFWQQGDRQAALLFGIKAPTGRTDVKDGAERLETEHQPGSGSWDGMLGAAASCMAGPVSLDANVLYTAAGEGAQETDLGDRFQYNIAASYRLKGSSGHHSHGNGNSHKHAARAGGAWDLVLELNGEWADRIEENDNLDDDSGGTMIFVSPGIRYVPNDKWSAHLSVGVPVASDLGKGHAEPDYRITFGIGRSF